jgi:hypothetical protein
MPEVLAGEIAAEGAFSSFGEYGLVGLMVGAMLYGIFRLSNKWIDTTIEREKRDADIRKNTYEALNGLTAALNRNTEVSCRQIDSMNKVSESVGKLPCTFRDPALRTRISDLRDVERAPIVDAG